MKNRNILNEISEMKYLFDYKRGRVISEQESADVTDFVVGGTQNVSVGPTTTLAPASSSSTASSSTTVKTTRKSTGLEVQKLLNTKYSAGLKEDGVLGPLSRGAIMNALEGSSGSSSSSTTASTTVAGSTTATTTVAGSTTATTTVAGAATSGGIDPNVVGQEVTLT
jgi:hypothetical protein